MIHLKKRFKINKHSEQLIQEVRSVLDESGNELERQVFDGQGRLLLQTSFSYHPAGLRLGTLVLDGNGTRRSSVSLEYDGQQHLIKRSFFDAQKQLAAYHVWIYDRESGLLTEFTKFGRDGQVRFRRKFVYDEQGRLIREEHYAQQERLSIVKVKSYDQKGLEIRELVFERGEKLVAQKFVLYNTYDLPIEISWYDAAERLQRLESFDYASDGTLLNEIILDFHGNRSFFRNYDEKGNIKLVQTQRNGRLVSEETFMYDLSARLILRAKYAIAGNHRKLTEKEQHFYQP